MHLLCCLKECPITGSIHDVLLTWAVNLNLLFQGSTKCTELPVVMMCTVASMPVCYSQPGLSLFHQCNIGEQGKSTMPSQQVTASSIWIGSQQLHPFCAPLLGRFRSFNLNFAR